VLKTLAFMAALATVAPALAETRPPLMLWTALHPTVQLPFAVSVAQLTNVALVSDTHDANRLATASQRSSSVPA